MLGFPPADNQVRDFLTSTRCYGDKDINESSNIRARCFLKALFRTTTMTIAELDDQFTPTKESRVRKFREFMSEGQCMSSSGPKRINFYQAVVSAASEVRRTCVFL